MAREQEVQKYKKKKKNLFWVLGLIGTALNVLTLFWGPVIFSHWTRWKADLEVS